MNPPLDYSTEELQSRPWLTALFVIAGLLAIPPLALGLFLLYYALVLGQEGAWEALWMAIGVTGASFGWIAGFWWLYRKVVVSVRTQRKNS